MINVLVVQFPLRPYLNFPCVASHQFISTKVNLTFFFFLSSHLLPMDLTTTILPVVTKDLPISPRFTPYNFLSRCKFSTLTTRQPMIEFYLLTFPRFPLRKKEHKSYFGKNRTHDFRTSRCAAYLLDHSGNANIINSKDHIRPYYYYYYYCSPELLYR